MDLELRRQQRQSFTESLNTLHSPALASVAADLETRLRESDAARDKAQAQYRDLLIDCERRSQGDYDKGVMTLSGGALAVSFSFVNTFLGDNVEAQKLWTLATAWLCWVVSLATLLASHYMSATALRWTLACHDAARRGTPVPKALPGWRDSAVGLLNAFAGTTFVVGTAFSGWFVYSNLR